MASYRVGLGHNLTYNDLEPILPEPANGFVTPMDRSYSISGKPIDHGLYVAFKWDMLPDLTTYNTAILHQFGLDTADSSEVTIYVMTPRLEWGIYNGLALFPQYGEDISYSSFFVRNLNLYVVDLEQIY